MTFTVPESINSTAIPLDADQEKVLLLTEIVCEKAKNPLLLNGIFSSVIIIIIEWMSDRVSEVCIWQKRRRLKIHVQCTTTELLTGRQVLCVLVERQEERMEEGKYQSIFYHPHPEKSIDLTKRWPTTCTVARRFALVSHVCVPDMGAATDSRQGFWGVHLSVWETEKERGYRMNVFQNFWVVCLPVERQEERREEDKWKMYWID